jgi:hypothetical protein
MVKNSSYHDIGGAQAELQRARTMFSRIGASTRLASLDFELAELCEISARDH